MLELAETDSSWTTLRSPLIDLFGRPGVNTTTDRAKHVGRGIVAHEGGKTDRAIKSATWADVVNQYPSWW
jgi:hypothetical protein